MKNHTRNGFLICLGVTLVTLLLYLFGAFDAAELKAVDARFQIRGNRPVDPGIAIVTVDEASIEALGRWPWPRARHGELVRRLSQAGARAIVFDSLFTEVDRANPASDRAFARASGDAGNVVSAFFFNSEIDRSNTGRDPVFPYQALLENSPMIGFVNLEPDDDGVTRRAKIYAISDGAAYPSLAVAAFAVGTGRTFEDVAPDLPATISANPVLASNELLINFAFSPVKETYPAYAYVSVLNGEIDPALFRDKIVFIGATAAGLFDLKAIPFISKYPGVLVHANVVDNLKNGAWLRKLGAEWSALAVLLIGLALGWLLPRLSPWAQLPLFLAIAGAGLGLSQALFANGNLVIDTVPSIVAAIGCYGGVLFYRLVIEEREKRKIKGSFRQYLSPKIIEVITKDPTKLKLGGEEREVTVFFLDIAGFTTMSEALKPAQLVEVMNECLTRFSGIILKRDGLINKYIGDCIMAFWNAPADQDRHAALACLAGLDCIAALPHLNRRFQEKGLPSIDCRVGINTGTVVVGNMGSKERFDYTVMGDPVNLASRLEGANKQYHTHVMISEETFEQAKGEIEARDIDLIRVKGKKEPKRVFELLAKKGEMPAEMESGRRKYHDALKLYRDRKFDDAIYAFQEVFDYLPDDHLTRVYLERCRQFVIAPPPGLWDGVYEMKTK